MERTLRENVYLMKRKLKTLKFKKFLFSDNLSKLIAHNILKGYTINFSPRKLTRCSIGILYGNQRPIDDKMIQGVVMCFPHFDKYIIFYL